MKVITYKINDDMKVIDNTPQAEIRYSNLVYFEEKMERERKREIKNITKISRLKKSLLWKVACICGIL